MRTVLVNPLRATQTIHKGQLVHGKVSQTRKRRRANPGPIVFTNPMRKRRRTNSNPLILPNRRRRRRNPFAPAQSLKGFLMVAGTGLLAGGSVYLVDRLLIQKLGVQTDSSGRVQTDSNGQPMDTPGGALLRNGVRLGLGALAAYLFPGAFGAGVMGAVSYPIMGALEAWWRRNSATTSDAYGTANENGAELDAELSDLEAELNDILEAA